MKRRRFLFGSAAIGAVALNPKNANAFRNPEYINPTHQVTLSKAHRGTLEIDRKLLDSYGPPEANRRAFYLAAREIFASDPEASFSHPRMVDAAEQNRIAIMGGPLLGQLRHDGVTLWFRTGTAKRIRVVVGQESFERADGTDKTSAPSPGEVVKIPIDGLNPDQRYEYEVLADDQKVASGGFRTAPPHDQPKKFRLVFGSCFHKIGLHNPNLAAQILAREPHAMMMLGDLAVDDRNANIAMHRSDYQLRDVSKAWNSLASNVPLYAAWDDHDYLDNDLSGVPGGFESRDRDRLRAVWGENWNNPPSPSRGQGIQFTTRVGPVQIIMLDTRSCCDNQRRRKPHCYLGESQLDWLLQTLRTSTAPFKVISSGTMWSDYVSNGKDSWGTWDPEIRERIFDVIERENIGGVLLVSGDRHGARAFRIPRPSGFAFHEFEPATLGGVSGPPAIVKGCEDQIFGYGQDGLIAFGEFTFETDRKSPQVTFRLINERGSILEKHPLSLSQLSPEA